MASPTDVCELHAMTVRIIAIDTAGLGDRSYIAHDGEIALVVDPQRDTDRVEEILKSEGVRLGMIVETHIHNDYVSGGYQLARTHGVPYVVNADDPVDFERTGVRDGDELVCGSMKIKVIHTPGHTFTHVSYALYDADGTAAGVFTGGSLLHSSTGRPDLLGQQFAEELARHQHASAHRLVSMLDDATPIHPTHGFGSFCSSTVSGVLASTIGDEKMANPALRDDVDTYVRDLLNGLDAYPAYYKHMGPANSAGPAPIDLSLPQRATAEDIKAALDRQEWVVDLRTRTAFIQGHVSGTYNFGVDGSFVTYLGWLFPYGTPLTLLGDTPEQVQEAQRGLVRIGIDRVERMGVGQASDWAVDGLETTAVGSFAEVPAALAAGDLLVDVRRNSEYRHAHIEGALHVPLHELLARMHELPRSRRIWVHCESAYRASIAVSVMQAAGLDVVMVSEPFASARLVPALTIVEGADVHATVAPSDLGITADV